MERLKRLVDKYHLGRVSCNNSQMKNGNYVATIRIGLETFYSYPDEFADVHEAYECAAQRALEQLELVPNWMKPAQ